ncbi:dnaJ homolog subfamily C member 4 isoform X4 [Nerophis lumbriciformis]|uniref:dnaJ homolog subfamily C member 4 isoform X4 n=1 Tax=Nerophis lumbriciformis TaxID=546530 RepID=UPI003BAC3D92
MQLEAQLRLYQTCLWCCKSGLRLFSHRKSANYYDLLGVKSDATLDEIKHAFFDKSKKCGLTRAWCATADTPGPRPVQPGAARPVCAVERGLPCAEQGAQQEGVRLQNQRGRPHLPIRIQSHKQPCRGAGQHALLGTGAPVSRQGDVCRGEGAAPQEELPPDGLLPAHHDAQHRTALRLLQKTGRGPNQLPGREGSRHLRNIQRVQREGQGQRL